MSYSAAGLARRRASGIGFLHAEQTPYVPFFIRAIDLLTCRSRVSRLPSDASRTSYSSTSSASSSRAACDAFSPPSNFGKFASQFPATFGSGEAMALNSAVSLPRSSSSDFCSSCRSIGSICVIMHGLSSRVKKPVHHGLHRLFTHCGNQKIACGEYGMRDAKVFILR